MRYFKTYFLSICCVLFYLSTFFSDGRTDNIAVNPLKEMSQSFFKSFTSELFKSNQSITNCVADLIHWNNAMSKKKSWSLQMFYSWGENPERASNYNAYNLGNYDECINSIELNRKKIKGKYCLIELQHDLKFRRKLANVSASNNFHNKDKFETSRKRVVYSNGICIPHTCKSTEMENILQNILKFQNMTDAKLTINQNYCVTNDPLVWRTIDWISFIFFLLIGILVLLSTIYEYVVKYYHKKENTSDRLYKLLTSFSILTNTIKVISNSKNSKDLKFLNGLKATSILWIMISHRYMVDFSFPLKNHSDIENFKPSTISGIIASSHLGVDTFFVAGGFLLSFIQFKKTMKAKNFDVLSFYVHRIIRITPAVAASLLFFVTLFRYFGSGPIWNKMLQMYTTRCDKDWWSILLFIQNYIPENFCMPHLWYLSVDMQLYILSPILIYAFLLNKKIGWINMIFWISAIQITIFVMVFQNDWNAAYFSITSTAHRMKYFYRPAYTRAIPWLMGFSLGCLLTKKSRNAIKMKKLTVMSLWITCLTVMIAIICLLIPLQNADHKVTHSTDSMYNIFAKNIWALCVSWIITACYFGYGGLIDKFLSLSIWQIVGKLTFAMYLTHFMVILQSNGSMRYSIYWSSFKSFTASISDIILSLIISYLLVVSIELPFSHLEQVAFSKKKSKREAERINLTTIR